MATEIKTDLCVIGAGSGGLSVAAGAVQMGADVVLIEGGRMGGDCLNYGCVPSKALIAAAKHAHAMTTGAPFGITPVKPQVDFAAAKDHVFSAIEVIKPHDSVERFEGLGVRVIQKYARFDGPRQVLAGDKRIRARRFVIATGSSPFVPPIPGLDRIRHFTNENIFELRRKPRRLLVIGAGPIGLEMAQAHSRLGCEVVVIEGLVALGRSYEPHAKVVLEQLREEGVEIHEGTSAAIIGQHEDAIQVVSDTGSVFEGSHLLVAVGRKPNIDRLDLESAGVKATRGGITVDASLRTSNRRIYAIGDVTGGAQFTHVAGYHAGVVVKSALLGLPSKARTNHIPSATYTDPEIAEVGMTEDEARRAHGDRVEAVSFDFKDNDRAIAEGSRIGQIRVLVVRGKPVGASIVGAQAGELIQIWALAIANGLKMSAIANMVSPYPTLGEVNKRAAGAYFAKRLFGSASLKRLVRLVQRF
ncbi:MAG: FAD-dependent oxidoreductase [Rhodobacteraceae bacterium]|nr:FAD-dependent oxidoreductase [Paracoccaceae bacterium]